ncbi:MAG: hypothetical protein ACKV2O_03975 [Acidimicrobiales bacterium]
MQPSAAGKAAPDLVRQRARALQHATPLRIDVEAGSHLDANLNVGEGRRR